MEYFIEFVIDMAASSFRGFVIYAGGMFLLLSLMSRRVGGGHLRRAKRRHLIADGSGRAEDRFAAQHSASWGIMLSYIVPAGLFLLWLVMAVAAYLGG